MLGAISAANPKADIVEKMIHKSAGVPWETEDQKLLRKIGSLSARRLYLMTLITP